MKIADQMAYIIVCAHKSGAYLPERNVSELDRKTLIKDIADGQHTEVIQVLEINPVERICNDVSDEIFRAVVDLWAVEGEPLRDWQRDFVEQHCGMVAANAFPRAA